MAGRDVLVREGPGHPDPEIRVGVGGGGGGVGITIRRFPPGPTPGSATDHYSLISI